MSSEDYSDEEELEATLQNIVDQKSLKWIFVGGKGGVGKTTTSCSLAVTLAQSRESVLIISTDPAHNLSDAFGQKFSSVPTAVNGIDNLSALEIDPSVDLETGVDPLDTGGNTNFMAELATSIPGIDEAMSFAELMKQVQSMNFDVIVFDTAPTGHTLRLLSFPSVLTKGLNKLLELKERFSGITQQMTAMMNTMPGAEEKLMGKLEETKATVELINRQFQDPDATTFVCVCIPEFLSLFETERLVQELAKFDIDTHNIVVNQVLYVDQDSKCRKCRARERMQNKYLSQIEVLYDEYHVTKMPLLDEEVRGLSGLQQFSGLMLCADKSDHPLVLGSPSDETTC